LHLNGIHYEPTIYPLWLAGERFQERNRTVPCHVIVM